MDEESFRASVIVCTHNRRDTLAQTVRTLLRCDGEDGAFEVLVVDNASTDRTPHVLEELMHELRHRPLRVLREERLGKHRAQHRGARAARSPLLLYTDDDVEASAQWVQAFVDAFEAHSEMEAAAGPVRPLWESDPPAWLLEYMAADEYAVRGGECCGPLAIMDRGKDFLIGRDGYFFGNNMAIRYDALERYGGFRPGRVGGRAVGASEWGLVEAMQRSGGLIGYVPEAVVWHRVPKDRVQPEYFEQWWPGPVGEMFDRWHGRRRTPRAIASELWRILRSHWAAWLRASVTRRRPNAEAVRRRVRAANGLRELSFLWWMMTRRDVRAHLDTERFGP